MFVRSITDLLEWFDQENERTTMVMVNNAEYEELALNLPPMVPWFSQVGNDWGLTITRANKELRYLVLKHKLSILWLMKTKVNINASNSLINTLNCPNSCSIFAQDLSCGFLLVWNLDLEL